MSNSNSNDGSILAGFSAEALLGSDAHVIKEILALRDDLRYSTQGNEVSLDDSFIQLQSAVDSLPCIVLDTDVPPGTENEYQIRLSTAQEKVLDDCDRVLRAILSYQSKLKNAERAIKKYKADFMSWYVLAAAYVIAQHEVKFPPSQIKQLAEAEYTRLLDNVDVQVDNLISSVEHLIEEARQHKKIQSEKHNLGKDQANASWTSKMANFQGIAPNRADDMAQEIEEEDEDEEVPAFVSRQPQVGSAPEPVIVPEPISSVKLPTFELLSNPKLYIWEDGKPGIGEDPNKKTEPEVFITDECGPTVFIPANEAHRVVASNQDLLDEAKPGDTVVLRLQDKVTPTWGADALKAQHPMDAGCSIKLAAPEEVVNFLNADEPAFADISDSKPTCVGWTPETAMKPRKRLILTEDEDLM